MESLLRQAWEEISKRWGEAHRVTSLWQPTYPASAWVAPGIALGALIALGILAGVSLVALGVLLTALLASYLIVANVLGVSIEVTSH